MMYIDPKDRPLEWGDPPKYETNVSCYDGTGAVQVFCPRCIEFQNQIFQLEAEIRELKKKKE